MNQYIKPLTKKCVICGKCKVLNHHYLCDICYSKRQKELNKMKDKVKLNQYFKNKPKTKSNNKLTIIK